MKEIAALLIEYGAGFNYQQMGSDGEHIDIMEPFGNIVNYQGKYYFRVDGQEFTVTESSAAVRMIRYELEKLLIKETIGEE